KDALVGAVVALLSGRDVGAERRVAGGDFADEDATLIQRDGLGIGRGHLGAGGLRPDKRVAAAGGIKIVVPECLLVDGDGGGVGAAAVSLRQRPGGPVHLRLDAGLRRRFGRAPGEIPRLAGAAHAAGRADGANPYFVSDVAIDGRDDVKFRPFAEFATDAGGVKTVER